MGRENICLWDFITATGAGTFHGRGASVPLSDLAAGSTLGAALDSLRGRSVLIATREQLPTALALVELDGVARRMVLCTPELTPQQLAHIAATAQADAIVVDAPPAAASALAAYVLCARPTPGPVTRAAALATEWVLLTSGTTAAPKLVLHTLRSLAGALPTRPAAGSVSIWSTFYDIRRYGGLQIYLRAVLSGSSLVLSSAGEPTADFLARAAAAGVTHISGTPSHWRRVLMSGDAAVLEPRYVRLSGEVADQALLDNLRAAYPQALVAHAFASTEAGVAFEVNDGRAGFPAALVDSPSGDIALKVVDHTLRIRSGRTALRYLGSGPDVLLGEDGGYVDTGDLVELVEGRYYFRGRMGGVINVGGLKVYPEEVESVLNADPRVRMSLVRGRRNPITGAVVVAEVVLANPDGTGADAPDAVRAALLAACRRALAAHKVPAIVHFVAAQNVTAAGKLLRPNP